MKFTIKTQCLTTRYYEVEAKTKRKAENYYWKHFGNLDELKQLISTITFFQLGARTKELKTIKLKLKNQLKEMESK